MATDQQDIERRIRTYQKQLRRLTSELSLAEARERREIASDLHDHIGQALAFTKMKLTELRGNAVFSGPVVGVTTIKSFFFSTRCQNATYAMTE